MFCGNGFGRNILPVLSTIVTLMAGDKLKHTFYAQCRAHLFFSLYVIKWNGATRRYCDDMHPFADPCN